MSEFLQKFELDIQNDLQKLLNIEKQQKFSDTGFVTEFADGVAHIFGIMDAKIGQKISFTDSTNRSKNDTKDPKDPNLPEIYGTIVDLDESYVGCIVFGEEKYIKQFDTVEVHKIDKGKNDVEVLSVPVSESLLGRVVDPLCNFLDNDKTNFHTEELFHSEELPLERKAAGLTDRDKINEPLQTGLNVVDTCLPIGRGQRMLIVGDSGTGKTEIALQTILNNKDLICVYAAIGKKATEVGRIQNLIQRTKNNKVIIVASFANDPAPKVYLTPFTATTIAEYFRDQGIDVLIVYDDLTKHANAYRQISLLLKRPPGREAYPGDVFYLHSRILERSGKVKDFTGNHQEASQDYNELLNQYKHREKFNGKGSITALPIIETKQNDYSAYIPTNVISITDGQIYLSDKLFNEGIKPAVNLGISVSRIGDKAKHPIIKILSNLFVNSDPDKSKQSFKQAMAEFREKEKYRKFGFEISPEDQKKIQTGQLLLELFKQSSNVVFDKQIEMLLAINILYNKYLCPKNENDNESSQGANIEDNINWKDTLEKLCSKIKVKMVDKIIEISVDGTEFNFKTTNNSEFMENLQKAVLNLKHEFVKSETKEVN